MYLTGHADEVLVKQALAGGRLFPILALSTIEVLALSSTALTPGAGISTLVNAWSTGQHQGMLRRRHM